MKISYIGFEVVIDKEKWKVLLRKEKWKNYGLIPALLYDSPFMPTEKELALPNSLFTTMI